jgi:hypothetical protein
VKDNKFHLGEIKKKFEQVKQRLPQKIADDSKSFFNDSFKQGGFTNSTFQKWPEVQRRTPGTNAYKYPKTKKLSRRTKPILVLTGRLRDSIRITQVSFSRSVIRTDVSYAEAMNKKRRFIGISKTLNKRTHSLIKKEILKALKAK